MNTVYEIAIGCMSSLIVWWVINIVLSPLILIDNNIQYRKGEKKYVRIKNNSSFDAYNVLFRIEFRIDNNPDNSVKSTMTPIPSIKKGEVAWLELQSKDKEDFVTNFFAIPNEKNRIVIDAFYESKFGVKRTSTRKISLTYQRIM